MDTGSFFAKAKVADEMHFVGDYLVTSCGEFNHPTFVLSRPLLSELAKDAAADYRIIRFDAFTGVLPSLRWRVGLQS